MSAEPFRSLDNPGLAKYTPTITSNSSAVSPQVTTITLPRVGVWLVTIVAYMQGSTDHMMTSTYLVSFYDSASNDTLLSTLLGATARSTGSSFGLSTLTVSNPTSAGVCTITASWTDGASHTASWKAEARLLMAY